jgi:hypothetical protein
MARQRAETTPDKKKEEEEEEDQEEEEEEEELLRSLTVELFHLRLVDYPVQGEETWQR